MFETTQDERIFQRITANAAWFAGLALRPLKRWSTWRHIGVNAALGFIVCLLYLHFIGGRSYYPEFHRVKLTFRDAALHAIPIGIGVGFLMYLSRVWFDRR